MNKALIATLALVSCVVHLDRPPVAPARPACSIDGEIWSITVPVGWSCRGDYADTGTSPPTAAVTVNEFEAGALPPGTFPIVVESLTLSAHSSVLASRHVNVGDGEASLVEYFDSDIIIVQLAFQCATVGVVVKCGAVDDDSAATCRSIVSSVDVLCPR